MQTVQVERPGHGLISQQGQAYHTVRRGGGCCGAPQIRAPQIDPGK